MNQPRALMDYLRLATDYLQRCGSPSARLDAEVLLGHVLGMDRVSLYVNHDRPLVPREVDAYREVLRARGRGMPVAYITGKKEFLRMTLAVTPDVLIPRPETELLVEAVVRRLQPLDRPLLLADVGTGSGAIAIGLARGLPRARVLAVDISPAAAAVARRNAAAQGVADRIVILEGDLLAPVAAWLSGGTESAGAGGDHLNEHGRYTSGLDAVVSNPPYIPARDWEKLPRDVREFEPRVALDGGPDGLAVYRRLVPQAAAVLRPGGLLALEIGHDQENAVRALLEGDQWNAVRVEKDYAGHPRVVLATRRGGGGTAA